MTLRSHEYYIRLAEEEDAYRLPDIEESAGTLFAQTGDLTGDAQIKLLAEAEPISAHEHLEGMQQWQSWGVGRGGNWVAVRDSSSANDAGRTEKAISSVSEVVGFIKASLVNIIHTNEKGSERPGSSQSPAKHIIHIEELNVHPDHQRRGVAKKLIDAVRSTAKGFQTPATTPSHTNGSSRPEEESLSPVHVIAVTLTTMRDVAFNRPYYEKLDFELLETTTGGGGGGDYSNEDNKVEASFGTDALQIWLEDKKRFREMGDGSLGNRRCWMSWMCK